MARRTVRVPRVSTSPPDHDKARRSRGAAARRVGSRSRSRTVVLKIQRIARVSAGRRPCSDAGSENDVPATGDPLQGARWRRQRILGSAQPFSGRARRGLPQARARSRPREPTGEGIKEKTASAREISRVSVAPLRASQNGRTSHVSQGDLGSDVRGTSVTFLPATASPPADLPILGAGAHDTGRIEEPGEGVDLTRQTAESRVAQTASACEPSRGEIRMKARRPCATRSSASCRTHLLTLKEECDEMPALEHPRRRVAQRTGSAHDPRL